MLEEKELATIISTVIPGIILLIINLTIQILFSLSKSKKIEYIKKLQEIDLNKTDYASSFRNLINEKIENLLVIDKIYKNILIALKAITGIIFFVFIGFCFSFQELTKPNDTAESITFIFLIIFPAILFSTLILNSFALFNDRTYTFNDYLNSVGKLLISIGRVTKKSGAVAIRKRDLEQNKNTDVKFLLLYFCKYALSKNTPSKKDLNRATRILDKYEIKIKTSLKLFKIKIKLVISSSEFYYALGYSLVFFGIIIAHYILYFPSIIHNSLKEIEIYQQFKIIIQSNITENNFIHYFFIILAVLFIISVVGTNIGSYRARLKDTDLDK